MKFSQSKPLNKSLSITLKVLLSGLLIGILIWKVSLKAIIENLSSIGPIFLISAIIIFLFSFAMGCINIILLLSPLPQKISYFTVFKYYVVSWSIGLVVPGKIGEFSLVYFLKKEKIPLGEGFLISLLDKLITLIVVFSVALFGFWLFFPHDTATLLSVAVIFGLVLLGFFLISDTGRNFIKERILRKYSLKFTGFSSLLYVFLKEEKSMLLLNAGMTFIKLMAHAFGTFLIFIGLHQYVSIWIILIITAMVFIISIIPISLSGIGVKEAAFVAAFSKVNVPIDISTTAAILLLIIQYLIGAFFYILAGHEIYKQKEIA